MGTEGIRSDKHTRGGTAGGTACPASSRQPAARVSPAPGPHGLRMLRLHADTSCRTVIGRAEAATTAAIFPRPGPEAEASRTWCVDAPGPAGNSSPRGSWTSAVRSRAARPRWPRRPWRASWPSSWTCWSSRGTRRSRSAGTAAGPSARVGRAVPPARSAQTPENPPGGPASC